MKQTVNINLGGMPFVIDDDAYAMLDSYLTDVKTVFSHDEGCDEIVADMESRIAEILSAEVPHGRVVTVREVSAIIERIGTVSALSEEMGCQDSATNTAEVNDSPSQNNTQTAGAPIPPYPEKVRKRLYRDPDNRILGGVCAGIGAYFNIDPTWIRLIAVLLFFCSYSSLAIVYIVLWIIVPEAVTAAEKLQMRGEAQSLQNIGNEVRAAYADPYPSSRRGEGVTGFLSAAVKVILFVLAVLFAPVLVGLCIAILVIGVMLLMMAGWSIDLWPLAHDLTQGDTILGIGCGFCWCVALVIPIFLMIYSVFRPYFKLAPLPRRLNIGMAIAWVIGLIGVAVTTVILASAY